MVEETLLRYRIIYSKGPSLRFIGHLDLLRTWERTLRRAQVPMAHTKGFHPHQRINMGVALPLGFSSECELIDLWLEADMAEIDLKSKLSKVIPPGIQLHSIHKVDLGSPSLQRLIKFAEYRVGLGAEHSLEQVEEGIGNLLVQKEVRQERRGKEYDLRPLIESIMVSEVEDRVELCMRLSASEKGTGRPDEVMRALGYEPEQVQIVRTKLVLEE